MPSGDTCLVIPAGPVKTHLGSILFISTGVAVDAESKEKDLVQAALTGGGRHLRNVKIISLMRNRWASRDRGNLSLLQKMVRLVNVEDIKEG